MWSGELPASHCLQMPACVSSKRNHTLLQNCQPLPHKTTPSDEAGNSELCQSASRAKSRAALRYNKIQWFRCQTASKTSSTDQKHKENYYFGFWNTHPREGGRLAKTAEPGKKRVPSRRDTIFLWTGKSEGRAKIANSRLVDVKLPLYLILTTPPTQNHTFWDAYLALGKPPWAAC